MLFIFPFLFLSSFLSCRPQLQTLPARSIGPIRAEPTMRHPPYFSHDPSARTEFLAHSCKTTAYPSSGGLVLGFFTPVELAYLNLSRTKPANRSSSSAEEDALALGMLHLGAHWWPSWELYARHQEKILDGIPYDFHFPPEVKVAFPLPGNGAWIFKFSADRQTWEEGEGRQPYLPRKPDAWDAKINLVLTMDERCEVLKSFGARFYEKIEDCDDVALTLEDAMVRGKRYEKLLRKMEDMHYVDRWLEGTEEEGGGMQKKDIRELR